MYIVHGLRTPNEGINQRYLKNWADARCGRQNMLRPYLKIWEWEWIFGCAVKAISSLGIRSPCLKIFFRKYLLNLECQKVGIFRMKFLNLFQCGNAKHDVQTYYVLYLSAFTFTFVEDFCYNFKIFFKYQDVKHPVKLIFHAWTNCVTVSLFYYLVKLPFLGCFWP